MAGGPDALAQYTRGRRNPMKQEIPPAVRNSIRVMYVGFAVTVLDILLSILAVGRFDNQVSILGSGDAGQKVSNWAGLLDAGIFADVFGLVCWAVLAVSARRARGWTRVAGTVLLALYTLVMLLVAFGTKEDPGPRFTTLVVWVLGIAAALPLWSQQARQFFYAWRKP
jgi:hypothetical protein